MSHQPELRLLVLLNSVNLRENGDRCGVSVAKRSHFSFDHHLFDLGNRLCRVQALGTGFGAIHDRVAPVKFKGIFQIVQTLAGRLVPAVNDPTICVQKRRRAKIAIAIPPI